MNKEIQIGSHRIGAGHPAFLVAEIGINHNGDLALAKATIDAAADAGADGVKFQNFVTEEFISDRSLMYTYESQGQTITEPQYDMFKRYELSFDMLKELKAHCDARKVIFHSTPSGLQGIEQLVSLGTLVLKNGSDYLPNLQVIRAMGKTGLPTVISTGMATLAEVDDAVRAFQETGNSQLIILHCVSSYPTPADQVHLKKIPALAAAFECLIGFSDHTWGTVSATGAIVFGACWIEKHFTVDKKLPGPDHRFSADPAEFRALVDAVRTIEKNLGESAIRPTASEELGRREYRLSCVAARDLPQGQVLQSEDIAFRRPGMGLPPRDVAWLIGRHLKTNVARGHVFQPEDIV